MLQCYLTPLSTIEQGLMQSKPCLVSCLARQVTGVFRSPQRTMILPLHYKRQFELRSGARSFCPPTELQTQKKRAEHQARRNIVFHILLDRRRALHSQRQVTIDTTDFLCAALHLPLF